MSTRLRDVHYRLFEEWAGEDVGFGYHFKALEHRTGLSRETIRPLVRDLADAGYLKFMRGCFTEDGEPYGAAYVLTEDGRAALRSLHGGEDV